MQDNQYYLPIETGDMSELTDILLNSVVTEEQHARSTTSSNEPPHACALLVYRPQRDGEGCFAISSLQKITPIKIDRLVFGPAVPNHKADLALLIMSLSYMNLDQISEHSSHNYH